MLQTTKTVIYEWLQASDYNPDIPLEDFIRYGCGHRHYLRAVGVERDTPEHGGSLLLRKAHKNMKDIIAGYMVETFRPNPVEGKKQPSAFTRFRPQILGGFVEIDAVGILEGKRLVDIVFIPHERFDHARPPRAALIAAAVKADALGLPKASLICFDQNSQVWTFWNIDGDYSKLGEMVSSEINHLASVLEGKTHTLPSASESTCVSCPFKGTCDVPPDGLLGDPPPFSPKALRTRPNHQLESEIEAWLWALNNKPNGRKTGIISPSEISTTECDRQIAYGLNATEQRRRIEPKLRRIFDMGHAIHDAVQFILRRALPTFRDEVSFRNDALRMSGSCDGVEDNDDGYEFKSISLLGFAKLSKPKKEHEIQATIYAANLELDAVNYLYINKEDGDLADYRVPVNRKVWHKLAARAERIVKTVDNGDLPPQIDKQYICSKCKYAWTCKPTTSARSTALPHGGFRK